MSNFQEIPTEAPESLDTVEATQESVESPLLEQSNNDAVVQDEVQEEQVTNVQEIPSLEISEPSNLPTDEPPPYSPPTYAQTVLQNTYYPAHYEGQVVPGLTTSHAPPLAGPSPLGSYTTDTDEHRLFCSNCIAWTRTQAVKRPSQFQLISSALLCWVMPLASCLPFMINQCWEHELRCSNCGIIMDGIDSAVVA